MNAAAFRKLVGPTLIHVTRTQNAAGIMCQGLLCASELARQAGVDERDILLRRDRRMLATQNGVAQLNHQLPLRLGLNKAAQFLDGHSLESWAAQLDRRIFFWPSRKGTAFAASLGEKSLVLTLDAEAFFEALSESIYLSPINSGNADRRPAWRGDWIYVPASAGVEAFRENRVRRGLVKSRDAVSEISITCPLPIDVLSKIAL